MGLRPAPPVTREKTQSRCGHTLVQHCQYHKLSHLQLQLLTVQVIYRDALLTQTQVFLNM